MEPKRQDYVFYKQVTPNGVKFFLDKTMNWLQRSPVFIEKIKNRAGLRRSLLNSDRILIGNHHNYFNAPALGQ